MSFVGYTQYKMTNIEWLGSIPADWQLSRLKFVTTCNDEVLPEGFDPEEEINYIEISDVSLNLGVTNVSKLAFGAAPSRARRIVRHGDILISTVRTYLKAIAQVTQPELNTIASTGFAVIRPKESFSTSGFLKYLAHDEGFIGEVISRSTGVSYPAINSSDLISIDLPLPPITEQTQIARFLDHEVGKIDALIAEQEKLIALLKEKRQAVISHAVTKGLNPNAPMKESGVEWLGQVPEHWSVPKVSHVFFLQSGDSITAAEIEEVGSYEVFGGNGLRGYTEKYNCEGTYNLIGRQGALCGNVHMVSGKFFASEHAIVVYPLKELDVAFYRYFLEFMNLGQYSTAAAQPGISVEVISQLRIAFPPAFEQNLISNFIHSNLSEIGQLQSECTDLINLLKERRSALISAAVTGKIDVRGWQPPAAQ